MNIAMEGKHQMLNEDAARFSIKEVSTGDDAFTYKVLDKRTVVCEADTMKKALWVRDALLLDVLASKANLEPEAG